jgi:hypothetical protein
LEQLDDAPASFMGDGAYDRSHVLDTVLAKNPTVRFIVPPCKGAMLGSTATTAPTQRNLHIRSINVCDGLTGPRVQGPDVWTGCYSGLSGPPTGAHFHGPFSYVDVTSEQNGPIQVVALDFFIPNIRGKFEV